MKNHLFLRSLNCGPPSPGSPSLHLLSSPPTMTLTPHAAAETTTLISNELPTILLVQGSFHTLSAYAELVIRLKAFYHPALHPNLPSCSNTNSSDFPDITLIDDALAIRRELTRQVEYEAKIVVVVMHSYGGLVGSEAIPEDLSSTQRKPLGRRGRCDPSDFLQRVHTRRRRICA